jgi:hypothetical protein
MTVAGEAYGLQKNRACHAYGCEHDKSRYGHKQTALGPKISTSWGCAAFGNRAHNFHRWPCHATARLVLENYNDLSSDHQKRGPLLFVVQQDHASAGRRKKAEACKLRVIEMAQ